MMRMELERQALRLFDLMLDQPLAEREGWLTVATEGDTALIDAVRALLEADRGSAAMPTEPPGGSAEVEPPPPPERLGHYRLGRELGRGGMGVVYLAERADGLFDQRVAVKLMRRAVSPRGAAAFEVERRLLAKVEHPNVARLIDGGVAPDGRPWLATEYVPGVPIDANAAARPVATSLAIFLQAAYAVQFAHSRLVAHGDLKPVNLLVDDDGRVRLLDFGVARLFGTEAGPAESSFTPEFASPERRAGSLPSVADDIFGLGRTLAAMTGAGADRELRAVIACATAPKAERYRSVPALISDVERWLAGRPLAAMNGGAAYRLRKFIGRHRVAVIASMVAVAGLVASAAVAERNYRSAETARAAEALRFADAHRAAHYLMFTLLDQLERRPGTLRLRVQVGDVAQVYLDRLAKSPGASRDVRLDVARGYLRAAATSGMSNAPNLGDVNRAARDLARADRMLEALRREQPGWVALAGPLARTASLQCQNQLYGSHDAAKALRAASAGLVKLAAFDHATQARARWAVRICAGDALVWLDRTDRAIPLLEGELAAGRLRNPLDREMLERNLRILGEAYFYARRYDDAVRTLKAAAVVEGALRAQAPFYGPAVIEAANIADDLASTYSQQHRFADQRRVAQQALDLVLAQVALDPDDVQSRRRALSMMRLVAGAQDALGRPAAGAALMRRANVQWAELERAFPGDSATARLRLLALHVTADLERHAGRRAAACALYQEAGRGWDAFARRWRLSPSDAGESVAPNARNIDACAHHGRFIDG